MSKPASPYYSSDLSRFCAEELGRPEFNFLDGDEVLLRYPSLPIHYARSTKILRIIESKKPGEDLRRSQREVLPLLASALFLGVQGGIFAEGSGVFIIEGRYPFTDGALVSQVLPASEARAAGVQYLGPERLTRSDVETLVSCRRRLRLAA